MAEAMLFPSSPWPNDLLLPLREGFKFLDPDLGRSQDPIFLDDNLESCASPPWKQWEETMLPSTTTSAATSDCSDDISLSLGLDEELDPLDWLLDRGSTPTSASHVTVFGEKVLSNPVSITCRDQEPDWSESDNDVTEDLDLEEACPLVTHSTVRSRPCCRKSTPRMPCSPNRKSVSAFNDQKPWSELDSVQQRSVVQDLTEIVSGQLGLREQLEVIQIINPRATLSPTDTEFVIDLNCLTDDKLIQVREYIKQHIPGSPKGSGGGNRSTRKRSQDHSHDDSSDATRAQSEQCAHKRSSPKQTIRQVARLKKQRQRKEKRQMLKESRSGLFKTEEVMTISTCHSEDDDDNIDILT